MRGGGRQVAVGGAPSPVGICRRQRRVRDRCRSGLEAAAAAQLEQRRPVLDRRDGLAAADRWRGDAV